MLRGGSVQALAAGMFSTNRKAPAMVISTFEKIYIGENCGSSSGYGVRQGLQVAMQDATHRLLGCG